MIKAGFFIQLVGASFFLILNIYLAKRGYTDYQIAHFISYRFLAVMLLAFPLGIYIKGKKLKSFFLVGSIGVPAVAIVIISAVKFKLDYYLPLLFILWGVFFTLFQVSSLPYIMRNTNEKKQSHAIALNYATNSFGMILSGFIIYISGKLMNEIDEGYILFWIALFSFIGVYFLLKMKVDIVADDNVRTRWNSYDWDLLIKAIIPTLIIAIGAGLTIPFINLFFFHNFKIDSTGFAVIGGVASIFVAILALSVPSVKQKLGFKKGITYTQMLAVIALIALATTEFYNTYFWALPLAIACYWIRTPLMNMAAPMTSELTMKYVGEKNQEMLSAVMAAIWSGSWFFSSQIFGYLKSIGLKYAYIFYITAILYSVGIFMYYLLIIDYERRIKNQIN